MVYYTADLHIGHANILKHTNRPFATLDEMNAELCKRWNRRVKKNDTVYILGDIFFRNAVPASEYLQELNGKKHLIVGNHDKDWMKKTDLDAFFQSVQHFAEISDGNHKLVLCHYPLMTWNGASRGRYMIHGHIHDNTGSDYWPLLRNMPHALNASVEVNGYEPVTFDELVANNIAFKEAHGT
jgi:calcineurin-like phosphoesterase family protein